MSFKGQVTEQTTVKWSIHRPARESSDLRNVNRKRDRCIFYSNLRSGVPYIFCRGGKVRLIQLFDYMSAAPQLKYLSAQMSAMPSPESQTEVLRVIDRSDRNPPITAISVTFIPSLRHTSGL